MMHGHEKSDHAIVAVKPANKAERPSAERSAAEPDAAEPAEPRAGTEGNAGQQSTRRTQSWESVSQALERVRRVARERKKEKFTSLLHHVSVELLDEAFFELKEDAAPGIDGLTWPEYEQTSIVILRTCMPGSIGERIGRFHHGEHTYRSRMDDSARSRLPRWKTRLSKERWLRC